MKLLVMLTFGFIFSLMISCGETTSNDSTEVAADTTKTEAIPEPVIFNAANDLKAKLIGTWYFNHEPSCREFKEDGTFRDFVEAGMLDPTSEAQEYATGTWSVEGDQITMNSSNDVAMNTKVTWVNENVVYFGDLEGMSEGEGMEMGWTKK